MKYQSTISPRDYFTQQGIKFKETNGGRELVIQCPFGEHTHDNTRPACCVNAETGVFYCHKCPKEIGSGSFKQLIEVLGGQYFDTPYMENSAKPIKPKAKTKISESNIERYHQALPDDIRKYLNERGITDEMIVEYKIGWGEFYGEQRIAIPIRDTNGNILFVKARRNPFDEDKDDGKKFVVYPSGSETTIFPANEIAAYKDEVVICEGEFDCMVLRSHGIPAITSTGGAGTFKEEWIEEYLQQFKKIYICLDKDDAGEEAAPRLIEKLARLLQKAELHRVEFPKRMTGGKDVTDYFTKYSGTRDEFMNELPRWIGGRKPIDVSQFKAITTDELTDILGLTVKRDDENKLVTFLAMLSAYTEESQFNISFNAPSSTGKSFVPLEIVNLFPNVDAIIIAYCSPTAFFHEVGMYDKKRKGQVVDLSRKILIFLDQPHMHLLERLRPMLSHDRRELELKITDKSQHSGLRAKTVFLKGYPAVVFCSAGMRIDEQESTRFILLSPEISQEKFREGVAERIRKESDKEAYVSWVEQDPRRLSLKSRIEAIREENISDVKIPQSEAIAELFLKDKKLLRGRHMRDVGRFISLIKVFTLLNVWFREREGEDVVIADEHDITEAKRVWEKISESQDYNLPPFVLKVYKDGVLPAWIAKNGDGIMGERRGITRQEVRSKYYESNGELIEDWRLRQDILPSLETAGLIEQESDPDNKSRKLIYVLTQ